MIVKELKKILTNFDEDKEVSIYLKLTSNFGILYEIEDWADNNGHLDLWISDTTENLMTEIKSIEKE